MLKKSVNNLTLFINSIYSVFNRLLSMIFPLITSIYVSRILGVEKVGIVSSAQNIVLYFTTIASLGLPVYGIKRIAEKKDDRRQQSKVFFELFTINLLSTLLSVVIYIIAIFNVKKFNAQIVLYIICGINIYFNIFNVDWYYQGREEYRYITIRNTAVKTLSFLLIILFVKNDNDYLIYALLSSTGLVFNYLFNVFNLKKSLIFDHYNLEISKHLKPVLILLLSTVAVDIYTLADTTMLTFMTDSSRVGLYSTGLKIIRVIRGLVTAVCAVFLPRLSYYYLNGYKNKFNKIIKTGFALILLLSIPAAIGLYLEADFLIPLFFGHEYAEAIIAVQILSVSIVSVGLSAFFGNQVLVTIGKEKTVLTSTIIGAVSNVILNYFFISAYQIYGAAFASVITEIFVTTYQMFVIRKEYIPKLKLCFFVSIILSCVFMIVSVIIMRKITDYSLIGNVFSIFIGASVYFCSLVITKNPALEILKYRIKR